VAGGGGSGGSGAHMLPACLQLVINSGMLPTCCLLACSWSSILAYCPHAACLPAADHPFWHAAHMLHTAHSTGPHPVCLPACLPARREFLDSGLKVALVVKHKMQEAEAAAGAGDYLAARLQGEAGAELERREAGSRNLVIVLRPTKQKADS
jgi:hypothetical protein